MKYRVNILGFWNVPLDHVQLSTLRSALKLHMLDALPCALPGEWIAFVHVTLCSVWGLLEAMSFIPILFSLLCEFAELEAILAV